MFTASPEKPSLELIEQSPVKSESFKHLTRNSFFCPLSSYTDGRYKKMISHSWYTQSSVIVTYIQLYLYE